MNFSKAIGNLEAIPGAAAPVPGEPDFRQIIRSEERKLFWMDVGFGISGTLLAIYVFLLITGKA